MAKEVEMLIGVSGIYVFYLLYGIVQERVYMLPLCCLLDFFLFCFVFLFCFFFGS